MPISLKNTASILPWARYSPRTNKMLISGEDNKSREVAFVGKSLAIDIENGMPGWLLLGKGLRDWKPAPLDSDAPGPNHKRGFSILISAPKLLGSAEAFEMCSATGAHLSFCERLFNECEPHFGENAVPIVRITEAVAVSVGRGESRELHFEIVKYIPRPAAFTEALAKLRAADNATANKEAPAGNGADTEGDDFDEPEDVTTPKAESATEKAVETKPKTRGKKPPEPPSSDILADPIPY